MINKARVSAFAFILMTATISAYSGIAQATGNKGKVLIVLSSESVLPLTNGKTFKTGYYLNELIVPAQRFTAAGYKLVFANPTGNTPMVDQASVSPDYFDGSKVKLDQALKYQSTLNGLKHPITLRWIADHDLNRYAAVFVPGGPAPMIDLMADRNLGRILTYFHTHAKTTVLLCHAPIVLLSTTHNPELEQAALRVGDLPKAQKLASDWPYRGYHLTVFSDEEEEQAAKNVFHAEPQFLPALALKNAGGQVSTAAAWHSKVVQDRELISGQNPFSDAALMDAVLPMMQGKL